MKDESPFGSLAPRGLSKLLIEASRNTVLGHAEPRRVIWQIIRARGQDAYDMHVGNAKMRLHPADSSLERVLLLRPQKYCPGEMAFLRQALQPGFTLVDAGANIGVFSLSMASLPGVSVVAIEPSPVALSRLRFNIAASGYSNVRVAPVALSGAEGSVRFFVHKANIGLSGIGAAWADGSEIEVRSRTLAAIIDEYAVGHPYALKIDIERQEDAALMPFFRDAPSERWPDHVLIETIGHQGVPDCVSLMLARGYRRTFESRQNTGLSFEGQRSAAVQS